MVTFGRFVKDSRGFTLLGVTVAIGLMALVLVVALELSWRAWGLAAGSRESFNETTELRSAAMWVSRDLRRAGGVTEAAPGRLVLTVSGATVSYSLDGNELTREEGGSRRAVARGIAEANFGAEERNGGALVTAEFTGEKGGKVRTCVLVYAGS